MASPDEPAPVRVGVVGLGRRGQKLTQACLAVAGMEVTALAGASEDSVAQAAQHVTAQGRRRPAQLPGRDAYRALVERDDVDLVLVATPFDTHVPVMMAAMEAGTAVFAPDGRLWSTVCDVASLPIVAALVVASIGTYVVAGRPFTDGRMRLAAIAGVGLAGGIALAAIRPACLAGPLVDLPDDLATRWLANVTEAQGLVALAVDRPFLALSFIALPAVGLVVMAMEVRKGDHRWIPLMGLAAGATLAVVLQVRAAPVAMALAIPALGPLVTMVRARRWPAEALGQPLMVIATLLVTIGLPFVLADAVASARTAPTTERLPGCTGGPRLAELAGEPSGLVLAHLDLGPSILFHTNHSVVAAPYHRNVEGIRASFALLDAPTAGAELAAAGIDLVVVCPGQSGNSLYTTSGEDSLMARLLAGDPIPGLERVGDGPLVVHRVTVQP